MFGVDSPTAELELISVGSQILTDLGATQEDFVVKVNNRKLINSVYEYLGLTEDQQYQASKLIDRLNKITPEEYQTEVKQIIQNPEIEEKFLNLFTPRAWQEFLEIVPEELKSSEGVQEMIELFTKSESQGISNLVFDVTIMRGFDYYTGIVFEFFDTHPDNRRSMFGGGRYDDLVGMFDGPSVTGCGFGMGDVILRDFLETHNLLPEFTPEAAILVTALDQVAVPQAETLAAALRAKWKAVILDISDTKPGAKFKFADKKGIQTVYIIGENELAEGLVQVKNLTTGEQTSQKLSDVLDN
jgi:histidyl-tRNA synthetase